jgi:hypothetical protein
MKKLQLSSAYQITPFWLDFSLEPKLTTRIVAGTQMIAFGSNRWLVMRRKASRPLLHGWVAGILPLHLAIGIWAFPGFEKLAFLLGWPNLKFLEPIDWFYAVQQRGDYSLPQWDETWAWILALAAALNALEELRKGQLKRHKMHYEVVIVQLYWPASGIKRGHILHNSGRIPQQLEHVGVRIANDWIVSSSLTT